MDLFMTQYNHRYPMFVSPSPDIRTLKLYQSILDSILDVYIQLLPTTVYVSRCSLYSTNQGHVVSIFDLILPAVDKMMCPYV